MNKWPNKAEAMAKLVKEKNEAYGSSFDNAGKILRVLYPNGIKPEQYDDALTFTRMIDKMFRIANNPGAFGESPWDDLLGYSLLGAVRAEELKAANTDRAPRPMVEVFRDGALREEKQLWLNEPGFNEQQMNIYAAQSVTNNDGKAK